MGSSAKFKIEVEENCGNSPKKHLLKDLTIAFAKYDFDFCLSWMTDDVSFDFVGGDQLQGREKLEAIFDNAKNDPVQELLIKNIITHGNVASLDGKINFKERGTIAFCTVFKFRGFSKDAKIKQLTAYVIGLE